jgi:acetyltransferase-like isoleucine patch superfamily enzyme
MSVFAKLKRFATAPLPNKTLSLKIAWSKFTGIVYYRFVFAEFGRGSIIRCPLRLYNPNRIRIGNNVVINEKCRIEAVYSSVDGQPVLIIEDDVLIQNNVQITSHCNVHIGKGTGVGPNCVITDTTHPFMDVNDPRPIHARLSTAKSFVHIGEGCQLGAGTFIMPNVRIGRGSVIGANSVVRKNVPEYCVAAGNPAKVLLRYNRDQDRWIPQD